MHRERERVHTHIHTQIIIINLPEGSVTVTSPALSVCLSVSAHQASGVELGIGTWMLSHTHSPLVGKTFAATIINDGDGDGEQ